MTYTDAVNYIERDCPPGSKYGLERVEELIGRLGHPEKELKLIHVAGTNGKGSVSRMLQSVLTAAGYKTGIFNSPFLAEPTEYLCIDGRDASREEYSEMTELIRAAVENDIPMEDRPTEFEMSFAMSIKYFALKKCDFAIIECGLGGLTDATNCIPSPELAIITNIGLDHTKLLGDTIGKIAEQKSGIIKPGCSVVAYPSDAEALEIIEAVSRKNGCPYYVAGSLEKAQQSLKADEVSGLSLKGVFQKRNLAVVLKAVEVLRSRGTAIDASSVKIGLENVKWPARFEIISDDPLIILDGGHNEQCVAALCESLDSMNIHNAMFVIGVMADKNYTVMFEKLSRYARAVITTEPANPRRLSAAASSECWKKLSVSSIPVEAPSEAIKKAVELFKSDGCYDSIIVTGSLYMMGEIRSILL